MGGELFSSRLQQEETPSPVAPFLNLQDLQRAGPHGQVYSTINAFAEGAATPARPLQADEPAMETLEELLRQSRLNIEKGEEGPEGNDSVCQRVENFFSSKSRASVIGKAAASKLSSGSASGWPTLMPKDHDYSDSFPVFLKGLPSQSDAFNANQIACMRYSKGCHARNECEPSFCSCARSW
jgi:hypothetical protein